MKRLWPDSLFGRTVLVLLAGLVASNLAGMAIYVVDRATELARVRGEAVAGRIADAARTVAEAPLAERSRRVDFRLGSGLILMTRWTPESPLVSRHGDGWREGILRLAIESDLDGVGIGEVRVALGPPLLAYPDQAARERGASRGGQGRGRPPMEWGSERPDAPVRSAHPDMLGSAINVSLQLPDRSWLNLTLHTPPLPSFWTSVNFASIVLSALVVMALALWAVRRATKPLARIAEAAQRLGRDVNAPGLPETGPAEVRRVAQTFNVMQAQLQAYVSDRTEMLAAISHDLRTPITRVKLRAEFIEDQEIQQKTLADMEEMEAMIAATLAFARDDAATERSVIVDLAAVLRALCENARDSGAEAIYDGPEYLETMARPLAVKRLFTNLVDNAIKYGHRMRAALRSEEGWALVLVDDDGPGIPENEMEKVFRPFHRVEQSRNRETGGVGLGLSVVRSIVRAHGGEVMLSNRPEGGLRATVRLPLITGANTYQREIPRLTNPFRKNALRFTAAAATDLGLPRPEK